MADAAVGVSAGMDGSVTCSGRGWSLRCHRGSRHDGSRGRSLSGRRHRRGGVAHRR